MDTSHQDYHQKLEDFDNQPDHALGEKTFNDEVVQGRRRFMKGGLGLAVAGFLGGNLVNSAKAHFQVQPESPEIGFQSLPPQLDPNFDSVAVPEGYTAKVFFSWGDAVESGAAPWRRDGGNSWQSREAG